MAEGAHHLAPVDRGVVDDGLVAEGVSRVEEKEVGDVPAVVVRREVGDEPLRTEGLAGPEFPTPLKQALRLLHRRAMVEEVVEVILSLAERTQRSEVLLLAEVELAMEETIEELARAGREERRTEEAPAEGPGLGIGGEVVAIDGLPWDDHRAIVGAEAGCDEGGDGLHLHLVKRYLVADLDVRQLLRREVGEGQGGDEAHTRVKERGGTLE